MRPANFFAHPGDTIRGPRRLFWTAFAVRVVYMTLAHLWRIKPYGFSLEFGYEAGRIAAALVEGRGYADPFRNIYMVHTGPTAWLPPLYPLLMAAVFKLFGAYTALSAWLLLTINSLLSASTAVAVWELGARFARNARLRGLQLARWAGWLWALHPAAMQYAVKWLWEMTLTTFLFTWLLVLLLRMQQEPDRRTLVDWCRFGALWGAIALSNSSLLIFLPVSGVWLLWIARKRLGPALAGASAAGLLFLALLAPWTVRNYRVFHAFIPLRGNLGVEMALANGPGARGFLMEYNHPFQSPGALRRYAAIGEVAYSREQGALALATIEADPGLFWRNTLKRFDFFWVSVPHGSARHEAGEWVRVESYAFLSLAGLLGLGLALRRHVPAAGLWAGAFLLLPLPYYGVTVHARFRHPLEPLIAVLGVYLFQSAERVRPAWLRPWRDRACPASSGELHSIGWVSAQFFTGRRCRGGRIGRT